MKPKTAGTFATTLLFTAFHAHAIEVQRNGTANNLNLGAAWNGGSAPGTGDVAVWDTLATGNLNRAMGANLQWAGIRVTAPSGAVTIPNTGGFTLTLGGSGILLNGTTTSHNLRIDAPVVLSAGQTWTTTGLSNGPILTLTGSLDLGGNTLNVVTGTGVAALTNGRFQARDIDNGTISLGTGSQIQLTGLADGTDVTANFTGSGLASGLNGALDLRTVAATTYTLSGSLTQSGFIQSQGAGTVVLSNAANSFGRLSVVGGSTVSVNSIGNIGAASAAGSGTTATDLGGGTATGTFAYTGNTATTNRAFTRDARGQGIINVTTAGQTLTVSGNISGGSNATITALTGWTFGGAGNLTLNGVISNATGAAHATTLTKQDAGTVTLGGANTYLGSTVISGGKLLVNGTHTVGSGTTGSYTVNTGGTLGGTGTINLSGAGLGITVASGGKLGATSADDLALNLGIGALDVSGALGGPAGSMLFELGGPGSTLVSITGGLSLGSGLLNFDDFTFTPVSGFGGGIYTLFGGQSNLSGNLGTSLTGTISGLNSEISLSGNNVILTVVPEPSAFSFAGGLGLLLLIRRRR